MQLMSTFQTFKKGMLSVSEYVKTMTEVADALTSSGQVITGDYVIGYITDGVGPELDPVVVYIAVKLDSPSKTITFAEAKYVLQKFE